MADTVAGGETPPEAHFSPRALPQLQHVGEDMVQFERKVLWRWHHRHHVNVGENWQRLRPRRAITPAYSMPADPALKAWLSGFRRCIVGAAATASSKARACRSWSNVTPLVRFALSLMRTRRWCFAQFDKEDGVCLVSHDVWEQLHLQTLSSADYCDVDDPDMEVARMRSEYIRLAQRIGKHLKDDTLSSALKRSVFSAGASHAAVLKLLIKSHKVPVGLRNLHCASFSAFESLSSWVVMILDESLRQKRHLLTSSIDFVNRIRGAELGAEKTMIRVDVKHFFMSGTAQQLADFASRIVGNLQLRGLVYAAIHWLCSSQYIEWQSTVKRVIVGSGMGLKHSSAVADAAWFSLADKMLLQPGLARRFGFEHFCRFRDDVFLIANKGGVELWLNWLRRRVGCIFDFEVVEMSVHQVNMLAVQVYVNNGKIHTRPAEKPLAAPLDPQSAHNQCVHSAWPRTVMRGLADLCTNQRDVDKALKRFIRRFELSFFPSDYTDSLRNLARDIAGNHVRLVQRAPLTLSPISTQWLVVGFHPALRVHLSRAVHAWQKNAAWNAAWQQAWEHQAPSVRIAWRTVLPSFLTYVHRHSRADGRGCGG